MAISRSRKHGAIVLADFIQQRFDPAAPESHTRQIYDVLRQGILGGTLAPGLRLPPSRQLAADLGIARNTVVHVYEHLAAEGFVAAGVGQGTFVADTRPRRIVAAPALQRGEQLPRSGLSARGERLCALAGHARRQWGAFVPGVPDVTEFPAATWSRLLRAQWRHPQPELLTYSTVSGYAPLRQMLVHYLRASRGVQCQAEQLFITTGTHQSLHLLAYLLGDVGDTAWFEEPGYWGARSVFSAAGINCRPVAVDAEGMNLQAADMAVRPRFIFVSPSHQYPLGAVMSLSRRRQLLEFANMAGAWLIEDDYDSEFRYGGPPLSSLQGLDGKGQVLYLGTFSKTLFPGLRVGYLVVPEELVDSFTIGLAELYREGQLFTQAVLAAFMEGGHFASHIRRMRGIYGARRALLIEAIRREFGDRLEIIGSAAGLHLVIGLPGAVDDRELAAGALEAGIATRPLSNYYSRPAAARSGLVLGYGCVPEAAIGGQFGRLARLVEARLAAAG